MTEADYKKVPCIENEKEKEEIPDTYGLGIRHVQAFLLFLSLTLGYISRAHLGVTIVAMTDIPIKAASNDVHYNNTTVLNTLQSTRDEIKYSEDLQHSIKLTDNGKTTLLRVNETRRLNYNSTISPLANEIDLKQTEDVTSIWNIYRTYDWPKSTQELVQGSFFLGYLIMMFPTGLVVQRWGGKLPLQISLFVNGIVPMFIPWLTAWGGWKVLCACRLLQGLTQAGIFPSLHCLLANWVPVSERSSLNSYVYTGSGFGTIVAFQLGGILAASRWGWPSTFWLTGLMCLIGFCFVTIFGSNHPSEHKSVSDREKSYINGYFGDIKKENTKTPWKELLTSRHAWACFSGHIGSGATFVFFLTQFPTYMHSILHFNIKNSGLLSSLPYISAFISTVASGYLSDFCTNRKILSIKNARIIANSVGSVGTSVCIVAVTFTQEPKLAIILFTTLLFFHSIAHSGWMVNYMDLSPNFSATLMACGNTLCNIVIVSIPLIVSSVVTDVSNPNQWRFVFLLMAGISFMANAFFVLFMSPDIQSWNNSEETNDPEEVKLQDHP